MIKIDNDFINNENNSSFQIIEPLWYCVVIDKDEQEYERTLKVFTLEQRLIFAIQWYMSEVCNGGHDQFFFNSTGIVYKDALEGFKVIGLEENYLILEEAVARMGGNPSLNWFERQNYLLDQNPNFEDLDSKFYKTTPEDALKNYILRNKKAFEFSHIK